LQLVTSYHGGVVWRVDLTTPSATENKH